MVLERRNLETGLGGGVLGPEDGVRPQAAGLCAKLRVLAGQEGAVLEGPRRGEEVHSDRFRLGEEKSSR